MKTKTVYITLSEAITWLALGQKYTSSDLRTELTNDCFGINYSAARQLLASGTNILMNEVQSGKIELRGKYLEQYQGNPSVTPTTAMTQLQAADFCAFDITCEGLRFGKEILWLPLEFDENFTLEIPAHPEHFEEISVNEGQLKTALRAGTPPAVPGPRLPDAHLKAWFSNLPTDEKTLPQEELHRRCLGAHPRNYVTRSRIREMAGPRALGRPKNNPP
jgi:hypothetical protein